MAQKIRTQDVMELFAEKLDKAIEKFDLNEKIITTVDGKLEEIKKTSLKVEFEPLKEVIKEISQIFEHFYRGENSSKNINGYGMGLALAKEIVTHHNGHIDVKSTTDELTIFTVVLPKNSKSLSVI